MVTIKRLARACVIESPSYRMRSSSALGGARGTSQVVRLDRNENRLGVPSFARSLLEESVANADLGAYPDPDADLVRSGVGAQWRVSPNNVIVGNGSIEVIQLALTAFVEPGDVVCVLDPSYELYTILTHVVGGRVVAIPLNEQWEADYLGIIAAVDDQAAKILLLCNPNNPTGKSLSCEQVRVICERAKDTLVVVDEAYADFAGLSVVELVHSVANLLVVRSLSKSAGLAALRIGYSVSHRDIADVLQKVRIPCSVNYPAQVAASTVLANWAIVEDMVHQIVAEREFLRAELNKLSGFCAHSSDANFLLIEVVDDRHSVPELAVRLLEEGFLVRRFEHRRLERCFRVSPGTHAENVDFLQVVRKVAAEGHQL
jgi:histidinol-phosphate aminotransferase